MKNKKPIKSKPIYIILFCFGMIFLFLSIGILFNKHIQIGDKFYGFNGFNIEYYSYCKSQESPRSILDKNDSNMYGYFEEGNFVNGSGFIEIKSDDYDVSLIALTPSQSMNPSLPEESKIITIPAYENFDYEIGDIICFWNKGYFPDLSTHHQICHRVIEMENGYLKTKGDNNIGDDGWIRREDINVIVVGVVF